MTPPTGIYAPGSGGKGTGLHPVDTRNANNQNLSRESLIRDAARTDIPPVTDQLEAHYAARLESFSDGDAVGTFTDQSGNGNDLTQATSSKKPTFRDNATDNIGGHPVVDFDGSDDRLSSGNFLSATEGEVVFVLDYNTKSAIQALFYNGDIDSQAYKLGFELLDGDTMRIVQDDNDTDDVVEGGTSLGAGSHILGYRSDGTQYNLRVDGTDESLTVAGGSNSGDWYGDTSNLDTISLGNRELSSISDRYTPSNIAEILVYEKHLTSAERSDIEGWLNNTVGYGIF